MYKAKIYKFNINKYESFSKNFNVEKYRSKKFNIYIKTNKNTGYLHCVIKKDNQIYIHYDIENINNTAFNICVNTDYIRYGNFLFEIIPTNKKIVSCIDLTITNLSYNSNILKDVDDSI